MILKENTVHNSVQVNPALKQTSSKIFLPNFIDIKYILKIKYFQSTKS
jgi:hypothetical protein